MAEEVAHTAGTHAHEHLHKVAAAHREEGHAGLSGYSLGQQGFTGSRRTYQQGTLGNLSSQVGIFLRILKEGDNLLHLLFGTGLSGHILEGHVQFIVLFIDAGFALAHTEYAAAGSTAAHPAHQENPDGHEHHKGQYIDEDVGHRVAVLVLVAVVACKLLLVSGLVDKRLQVVHRTVFHLDKGVCARLLDALFEYVAHVFCLHVHLQCLLVVVDDDAVGIAFEHHGLELRVGGGGLDARL